MNESLRNTVAPAVLLAVLLGLAACSAENGSESQMADKSKMEELSSSPEPLRETWREAPDATAPVPPSAGPEQTPEEEPRMQGTSLVGTEWWVEDIEGTGVIDNSHTTITFPEPGRVAGDGGCNRYMGSYEGEGDRLKFGPLASTRMACPEALMNQDDRFHQALARVVGW